MIIPKRFPISIVCSVLALASAAMVAAPPTFLAGQQTSPSSSADPWQVSRRSPAPSDEEIRARTQGLVANQHNDEQALEVYERTERHMDRTGGDNPRTLEDKTYRVVPTGGGAQKILLRDGDQPTDAAGYRRQLQELADVLQTMANPNDSKAKAAKAKYEKRERERAEFVDATKDAFVVQWLGTATVNGRACDVFDLNPNPNFHPRSMFQDALAHVTAKVWVDRQSNQLARGEARVMSDIPFGGGVLGKLYRGSVVSMEQTEVAPNVWLPIRYQYDFAGRKFLFSFQQHQVIEVTRYRRVGPPAGALAIMKAELASGKTFSELP